MTNEEYRRPGPAFHEGEAAIHERLGIREKMEERGRKVIRDFMPDQHRSFFAQLPFLILAATDEDGHPWASLLTGMPGFATSPDETVLDIEAMPDPADPALEGVEEGKLVGLLGIELHTRRRNRVNGRVARRTASGFSLHVSESFGNCPKYIQARTLEPVAVQEPAIRAFETLGAAERDMIAGADTFFIATAHPARGADASHRGGKPGFVRIDPDGTLTVPEFPGNLYFNTLGNLLVDARAGLLFPDFRTGTLLQLAAKAEIIWEGAELQRFAGAERLVRFRPSGGRRIERGLPLRASEAEMSPFLDRLGSWQPQPTAASRQ